MYEYTAYVTRVIDGDTVVVDIDLGFKSWRHGEELRLIGIQAPDRHPAKEAATAWLADLLPQHTALRITTIKDKREKYGRMLALIYKGDLCLNDAIVDAGHAVEWDGKGSKPDI